MPNSVLKGSPCPADAAAWRGAWRLSRLLLAALLLGGVGCNDLTGPRSVNVAISVTKVSPTVSATTPDSIPSINCTVDLSANASGRGSAIWFGGKILWYVGADRSVPVDSQTLSLQDVQGSWGTGEIATGQTQTSSWQVSDAVPFHAVMEYTYEPSSGGEKTTSVGFDCGPKVSPGTPAPSIDTITVQGGSASVQPSDTLTVNYTVSSTIGVWQTAVALSGPCATQEIFPANLQTTLTYSARIPIPAACELGVPLIVTVAARDAGLQTNSRSLTTQFALVDKTPPYVMASYNGHQFYPGGAATPLGIFFGDDSIVIHLIAGDNHVLQDAAWDVLPSGTGVEDSITVNDQGVDRFVWIHLRRGASGPIQLRFFARDAVGLSSDTLITPVGDFQVYPTADLPTASATVDGNTPDAIPDVRRQLAYLRQPQNKRIVVLSLSTMSVIQTIPLPAVPTDFDVTPSGDSLVVAMPNAGALGVIDLRTPPLTVSLIPLNGLDSATEQRPEFVRTLSNGKVFVSLFASTARAAMLDEIDLATGAQRIRTDAGDSGSVGGAVLGRSLDHSVVVLNAGATYFQRYDVSTDRFGPRMSSSAPQATPTLDSTGHYVAVGFTIFDASLSALRDAASSLLGPPAISTVLSADGTTLYEVLPDGTIVRVRVSDGAIVDRVMNPFANIYGKAEISDDGTLLMTTQGIGALGDPNEVGVIHLH